MSELDYDELNEFTAGRDEAEDVLIGQNIVRLRKEAGLSQEALAERMRDLGSTHWRQTTVSRIERGSQELKGGELDHLVKILGGDILAGTRTGRTMRDTMRRVADVVTERRLAKAEGALLAALAEIQELRSAYGISAYGNASADGEEGGDDGQHQEEG